MGAQAARRHRRRRPRRPPLPPLPLASCGATCRYAGYEAAEVGSCLCNELGAQLAQTPNPRAASREPRTAHHTGDLARHASGRLAVTIAAAHRRPAPAAVAAAGAAAPSPPWAAPIAAHKLSATAFSLCRAGSKKKVDTAPPAGGTMSARAGEQREAGEHIARASVGADAAEWRSDGGAVRCAVRCLGKWCAADDRQLTSRYRCRVVVPPDGSDVGVEGERVPAWRWAGSAGRDECQRHASQGWATHLTRGTAAVWSATSVALARLRAAI